MKSIIMILSLLGIFAAGQAQVIELDEAEVHYSPKAVVVSSEPGKMVFNIPEEYKNQFAGDAIKFMKNNFNMNTFITSQKEKFDSYVVNFRSSLGSLEADFGRNGKLIKTSQKFKNAYMPTALRKEIFLDNKGWNVVNYKYVASGKQDRIDKEVYKVRLENGNKRKTIKIRPDRNTKVASN